MAAETGVLAALAFVLLAAARAKLAPGEPNAPAISQRVRATLILRLQAAGEIGLAVFALAAPGRPVGLVVAAAFAGFTLVHVRSWRSGQGGDCDCFGRSGQGSPALQGLLTGAAAACAAAVALTQPPSLLHLVSSAPLTGVEVLVGAAAVAWLWERLFTTGPARPQAVGRLESLGEGLVPFSAAFLERRIPRRTMLLRLAAAGSALSVAPLRYLLYPGTALAAIGPGNCSSGLCTDGYTAFCCEINQGRNTCPAGTFAGGWWMCTDYTGRRLCHEQGVRYYVDCNSIPGDDRSGPCRCAHDSCSYRRVACNVFRYGQCNTQVSGVTPVVCRMIVCENPSTIDHLHCNSSVAVDDAVCGHDVPCLEPPARELTGAGGV